MKLHARGYAPLPAHNGKGVHRRARWRCDRGPCPRCREFPQWSPRRLFHASLRSCGKVFPQRRSTRSSPYGPEPSVRDRQAVVIGVPMGQAELIEHRNGPLHHEHVPASPGAPKFESELLWLCLAPTALQVAQQAVARPSIGIARNPAHRWCPIVCSLMDFASRLTRRQKSRASPRASALIGTLLTTGSKASSDIAAALWVEQRASQSDETNFRRHGRPLT